MRHALKGLVLAVFYVLILPSGLLARAAARFGGTEAVFNFFAEGLSDWPGLPGKYARLCFYKQTLAEVHFDNEFCFGTILSKMGTRLGPNVRIGARATLGLCRIHDGAIIGNSVSILSGRRQHNFSDPSKSLLAGGEHFEEIVVGANSFIGEKSIVMADVGERTIIGAGSVVVKPIPGNVIAAGNPARVVRSRDAAGSGPPAGA